MLYEKQTSGVAGTAGTDPYSPNLAISGDTQSTDIGETGNLARGLTKTETLVGPQRPLPKNDPWYYKYNPDKFIRQALFIS